LKVICVNNWYAFVFGFLFLSLFDQSTG
jgi:hypothetical protein